MHWTWMQTKKLDTSPGADTKLIKFNHLTFEIPILRYILNQVKIYLSLLADFKIFKRFRHTIDCSILKNVVER